MIGKAYTITTPYYDRITKSTKFKVRPCLIIGKADEGDYVILPISSVTDKTRLDPVYDILLEQSEYTFLDKDCYLRTHKQQVINIVMFKKEIADFKNLHEDKYVEVLAKVEEFQHKMISEAL